MCFFSTFFLKKKKCQIFRVFHSKLYNIRLRTAGLRNFLRNWSIRFPQGHRDGKGGGEERARGWPEQRDPDSGPWVLPSVFFPPQPLPFHPTPRQLRNPGAD